MVFNIYDTDRCSPMIDIEEYQKEVYGKTIRHIDTTICANGFSKFLIKNYEDFKNPQMLNLFLNDVKELTDMNFYLQEYWSREANYPIDSFDASYYVCKRIRKFVEQFCDKWNLNINED